MLPFCVWNVYVIYIYIHIWYHTWNTFFKSVMWCLNIVQRQRWYSSLILIPCYHHEWKRIPLYGSFCEENPTDTGGRGLLVLRFHVFVIVKLGKLQQTIHYNDVIMSAMASQITGVLIFYLTVSSGADQRKHQSSASLSFVRRIRSASLSFVRGIHRDKGPVTRKMFPFDDVIMFADDLRRNDAYGMPE